ncbi:MAG: polyprenyl diphosphate synthase [Promethearchaeota archaeon]
MEELKKLDKDKLPKHIALIIDGNRRWAAKKTLDVNAGHYAGYIALKNILFTFSETGIRYLSIYTLSYENIKKRDPEEIKYIYKMIIKAINDVINEPRTKEYKVNVNILGKLSLLPPDVKEKINEVIELTKDHNQYFINLLIAYDGREEIVDAVKKILEDNLSPAEIDQDLVKKYLYTKDIPEVDYIIRTGMEDGARISGFLLWDSSYAEFRFRDDYWPDYNEEMLIEDLKEYINRNRRKGE